MDTVSFKLKASHAEALSQMGRPEKRSRVGEMEKLIEKAWEKFSNNAPMPTPRGKNSTMQVQSGTRAHDENAGLRKTQDNLMRDAMIGAINLGGGEDKFRAMYSKSSTSVGVPTRPITPKDLEYFEALLQAKEDEKWA